MLVFTHVFVQTFPYLISHLFPRAMAWQVPYRMQKKKSVPELVTNDVEISINTEMT